MHDDPLTVIQKIRIIYECYVVFLFLAKHKELATPFLEHIKIIENKIFKDITVLDDNEEFLKSKEGYEYFCWTKNIIKEKANRNLTYLAQDIGIEKEMSLIYKLSSNYIHTNAYSAFIKNAVNQNFVRDYLPFVASIMLRQLIIFVKNVNNIENQNEMINVLLGGIEKVLYHQPS